MTSPSDDSFGKPPRIRPKNSSDPPPTIEFGSSETQDLDPPPTIEHGSSDTRDMDPPPTIELGSGDTRDMEPPPTIASTTSPSLKSEGKPFVEQSFGHYTLLGEIARGGMGVVFKARDEKLNRLVALKMILSGRFAAEADVRRFYQEAESAANLDHPGIVPIYEVGEFDGNHFFAMKLMEYGSLVQWLPTLRNKPRKSAELMAKVARSLHYAHQRGILHRDIKPANILIDSKANPLVSDLGLAKDLKSESDLTHSGAVVGTPGYMPPEQAAGSAEITTAADIYGVGAILYELLTGRRPHSGESVIETLRKVIDEDPAAPRSIDKKINRTLELICLKCLAKDPDDRYSSAGALADDLENWLEGKPVTARPPSVGSIFGSAIRQTVRSAAGAALVGLIAGLILSAIVWACLIAPNGNMINGIYNVLPSEPHPHVWATSPNGFWFAAAMAFAYGTWILIGWITTAVVRPKPGAPAIAVGLVTGLVMTLTLYSLGIGYYSVSEMTHSPLQEDVSLLTRGTVGTEEEREYAKRMFEWKYPDLKNVDAGNRAEVLEQKFLGDALMTVPYGILIGIVATLFTCVVTSVGGTMFASRMLERKKQLRWTLIPYLEVMTLMAVAIGGFTVLQWRRSLGASEGLPSIWLQLLVVVALLLAACAAYRRWRWYWRLFFHFAWMTAFLIYGVVYIQIGRGGFLAGYYVRQGDWETATRHIERRTAASPKWPYGHMMAGSCQALMGNRDAYRDHCEYVLNHYRKTIRPEHADLAGKLCLLRPDWLDDATPAIALGKFAEEEADKDDQLYEWFVMTRALAAYREGDLEGTDEWVEKCKAAEDNNYILATSKVIHAMALADRGRNDEASQEIEKALELMKADSWPTKHLWENIVIFETLLMEARSKLE